jgi:hypothetical protein
LSHAWKSASRSAPFEGSEIERFEKTLLMEVAGKQAAGRVPEESLD